ncbi:MAG: S26 family signal peptidase [Pseudomonadota bacterium]
MSLTLLFVSVFSLPKKLIWNRTDSAPIGLYWLSDGPLTLNRWAVVSADSADAIWAQQRGYIGRDWPLIKRVRGEPGDRICREKEIILINNVIVAEALKTDSFGRELPVWNDCVTLENDEVFLLNDHPNSLDGRYFGATRQQDVAGSAMLIWSKS